MQDISDLFARIASFFQLDEVVGYGELVLLPTTVYLDNDIRFVANCAEFNAMATDYVRRLRAMGVCDLTFEIASQEPLRRDGVRAKVIWHHIDKAGNTIHSVAANYFCRAENGSWRIALIEYVPETQARLRSVKPDS